MERSGPLKEERVESRKMVYGLMKKVSNTGPQWAGCMVHKWLYKTDPIVGIVRAGLRKSGCDIQLFSSSYNQVGSL
jgi:hypothetical protein